MKLPVGTQSKSQFDIYRDESFGIILGVLTDNGNHTHLKRELVGKVTFEDARSVLILRKNPEFSKDENFVKTIKFIEKEITDIYGTYICVDAGSEEGSSSVVPNSVSSVSVSNKNGALVECSSTRNASLKFIPTSDSTEAERKKRMKPT